MTRISPDLAARAAELLTVPMGWGSGPALNALAEKIGGRIADVAARNQTFREALEAVAHMGREPRQSARTAPIAYRYDWRLKMFATGDEGWHTTVGFNEPKEDQRNEYRNIVPLGPVVTDEPQEVPTRAELLEAMSIAKPILDQALTFANAHSKIKAIEKALGVARSSSMTRPHDRTGEA